MFIATLLIAGLMNFTPDVTQFPKWQRVLQEETVVEPEKEFDGNLVQLLKTEHNTYKDYKYIVDEQRYHKHDYWATRTEMEAEMCGDCEDFAIKSYFNLLEKGVRDEDMYIAIVFLYGSGMNHAVLVVKNEYVLDCMEDKVISQKQFYMGAKLLYGINRKGYYTPVQIPLQTL